ncbi:JmjC domain-containing histone demethylation protein 1 [Gonapodya sp. JEL0774]|nr:JmjC domain-containing histone demethylation protein 1 [Gonapodya sp. JEL0774]
MALFGQIRRKYEDLPLLLRPTRRRAKDVEPNIPVPEVNACDYPSLTPSVIRKRGLEGDVFVVRGVKGVFSPELRTPLDVIRTFPSKRSCTVFDCLTWKHRRMDFRELEKHFTQPPEEREGPLTVFDIELKGGAAEPPHTMPPFLAGLFDSPASAAQNAWGRHKIPQRQFLSHLLLSSDSAVTDFHVDFGGGHGAIYCLAGEKTVFMAPHDRDTRALYEKWLHDRDNGTWYWFPTITDPPIALKKCTLRAGDLLVMPGGTPHAVFTGADSAILTTNWLSYENAQTQMECIEQEEATGVPEKLRLVRFLVRRGMSSDAHRLRDTMRRRGVPEATTKHPVLVQTRVGPKTASFVVGRKERTVRPRASGNGTSATENNTVAPGWTEITRLVLDEGYRHLAHVVKSEGIEEDNVVEGTLERKLEGL